MTLTSKFLFAGKNFPTLFTPKQKSGPAFPHLHVARRILATRTRERKRLITDKEDWRQAGRRRGDGDDMGITGLLPLLKKASTSCHVRRFSGCTAAVDTYGWLHKGAFGCAVQLGKGEPTTAYINYCVKYINVLIAHNIKPVMVLDGRNLPSKEHTEKKRREKRQDNRKKAREYLKKGMKKEAWECFTKCVDITPQMARDFIKVLRDMKIDYIVAPYEADAQLAYLAKNNIVDLVITEDSDLVLFGCPKIFFKMTPAGDGVLFDETKIPQSLGMKKKDFSFERFRWMCILSGCDYLASLQGIGLGRARKLIDGNSTNDIPDLLRSLPRVLGLDVTVTEDYIQGFMQAELTFLYQLVFDTATRRVVPLTPYTGNIKPKDLPFAGAYLDLETALHLALGNIDLHSLKKVDNFDPDNAKNGYGKTSIWSQDFVIPSERKTLTARASSKKSEKGGAMKVNESVGKPKPARKIKIEEPPAPDTCDEDLVSMYSFASINDSADSCVSSVSQFTAVSASSSSSNEEGTKTSKRKRSQDLSSEEEEDFQKENETTSDPESEAPTKRRRNPFLKKENTNNSCETDADTPISTNSSEDKDMDVTLVCLIEKNKVYNDSEETFNVIVKSHYFRNSDEMVQLPQRRTVSTLSNGGEIKIENGEVSENNTPERVKSFCKIQIKDEEKSASQLSIYSGRHAVADSSTSSEEKTFSDQDKDTSIDTFDSDEDTNEPSGNRNGKHILRNSFLKFSQSPAEKKVKPTVTPKRSPSPIKILRSNAKSTTKNSSQRGGSSKAKTDPRQQKISAMFGLKPKPKL